VQQGILMHFQSQSTIPVFLTLISPVPLYKFDKRADVEHPRLLCHPRRLGRESIDPAIHFEDGGRKRARQRRFEEWQTEKPSEIDRGLSMCLGFIVGHISSCLYHDCGISKLCVFFFLRMCRYARDP